MTMELNEFTEMIRAKIDARQQSNLEILNVLRDYFLEEPDMRFCQALVNIGILHYDDDNDVIDPFYDESVDTLANMKK